MNRTAYDYPVSLETADTPPATSEPIVSVGLHLLRLEYEPCVVPYEWSGGVDRDFFTILAEVRTESGSGWGEGGFFQEIDALSASPALLEPWLDAASGRLLGRPVAEFRQLGHLLTNSLVPAAPAAAGEGLHVWQMARTAPLLWEPAAVAVELALWDLFARRAGIPLRALFGPGNRERVPLAAGIGAMEVQRASSIAAELTEKGFRTLKLKGGRGLDLDTRILEGVRAAVGSDVSLRLDPNSAYDIGQARRLAAAVERYDLEYLEQPCAFDQLANLAALRRTSSVPIALDEAVLGPSRVAEIYALQAADVVMLEFHQVGGVEQLLKTAATAEACGLPLGLHTSYVTGVRTAAVLQLAAATANLRYAPDTLWHGLKEDVLVDPIEFVDGSLLVPSGTGIGVDADVERVEARAIMSLLRVLEGNDGG